MAMGPPVTVWTGCRGFEHDGGEEDFIVVHGGLEVGSGSNVLVPDELRSSPALGCC